MRSRLERGALFRSISFERVGSNIRWRLFWLILIVSLSVSAYVGFLSRSRRPLSLARARARARAIATSQISCHHDAPALTQLRLSSTSASSAFPEKLEFPLNGHLHNHDG